MPFSIYNGDSREFSSIIPDGSVHAVVTDPPANIDYLTRSHWGVTDRDEMLAGVFEEAYRISVNGAYALVWSLPKEQHLTAAAIVKAGWKVIDVVCHHFGTGQPKSGRLKPATEFWTLAQKGSGRALNHSECMILDPANLPKKWSSPRGGFWSTESSEKSELVPNEAGRWPANLTLDEAMEPFLPRFFYVKKPLMSARNGHPTQKPDLLMEYLVRLVSFPGETIFDPFMGSGSTGVAALSQNRDFVGIEADEGYFRIAEKRLSEA